MATMSSTDVDKRLDENSSKSSPAFPYTALDHQLCVFLELFLDLMYADVVLNDRCCRLAGQALVTDQEATLQALLQTAGSVLPSGLQQAISTYCVRHVLLRAPELMLSSARAGDALLQLADHLTQDIESANRGNTGNRPDGNDQQRDAAAGAATAATIRDDVAALRVRLETKRYAHLIDALGDAVIGCIGAAEEEMSASAAKERDNVGPTRTQLSPFTQRFLPIVKRFACSARRERELRKRRREAMVDRSADALLFPAAAAVSQDTEEDASPPSKRAHPGDTVEHSFSDDIQAAMTTPTHRMLSPRPPALGSQAHCTTTANVAARVHHRHAPRVDDSVNAGVAALQSANPSADADTANSGWVQEEVSEVTVAASADQSVVGAVVRSRCARAAARNKAATVAGTEVSVLAEMVQPPVSVADGKEAEREEVPVVSPRSPAEAYVLSTRDVVERTYFLCVETNRYEPSSAMGFFHAA